MKVEIAIYWRAECAGIQTDSNFCTSVPAPHLEAPSCMSSASLQRQAPSQNYSIPYTPYSWQFLATQPNPKPTTMARLTTLVSLLATLPLISSTIIPLHNHQRPPRSNDKDDDNPLPLVIWHGLGDNFASEDLADVASLAESVNPGTWTYMIRVGDDASSDRSASFFGDLTQQVDKVCADIAAHQILSTAPAIDALGFSQGGLFLRAYVERCNSPPVRSLVTFGSPHNGISDFQKCATTDWLCKGSEALLRSNTWSSYVQTHLVPAQYFRDPNQFDQYLEYSNFLADINNERELKNQTYKENLSQLERWVLYLFEGDETLVPKESSWFAEVDGEDVTLLKDRPIYKEDWLGLKTLDKKGALKFEKTEGRHLSLSDTLLKKIFKDNYGPFGMKLGGNEEGREDL